MNSKIAGFRSLTFLCRTIVLCFLMYDSLGNTNEVLSKTVSIFMMLLDEVVRYYICCAAGQQLQNKVMKGTKVSLGIYKQNIGYFVAFARRFICGASRLFSHTRDVHA